MRKKRANLPDVPAVRDGSPQHRRLAGRIGGMRYRLSSLLLLLTLGPPLLAGVWLLRNGRLSPLESAQLWLAGALLLCIALAPLAAAPAAWLIDAIIAAWRPPKRPY